MRKSARLTLAILTLGISILLLLWSFLPAARNIRRQRIEPTQMQVPTPNSFSQPKDHLVQETQNPPVALMKAGFVILNL